MNGYVEKITELFEDDKKEKSMGRMRQSLSAKIVIMKVLFADWRRY